MAEKTKDKEITEGKFFAVISYVSFLCVVTLLLRKDNKFALYHGKQGLVLFVVEVVCFFVVAVPLLGPLTSSLGFLLALLASLWGIFKAYEGVYAKIPFVTEIASQITL